jgi:hypothetical protein
MGPLQVGEYSGRASYQYDIVKGDTLLNGPFDLRSIDLNALLSGGDSYFSIEGSFKDHAPDSTWQLQWGEFQASEGIEFRDYQFQVPIDGIQHTARVSFLAGEPQGEWTQIVHAIESSAVEQKVFESHVRFEGGLPQGVFRLEDAESIMLGRFLPNGLAHDCWELDFETTLGKVEQWCFANGRLERMLIRTDRGTDTLLVYNEPIQRSETINLDERYFQILGFQGVFDSVAYAEQKGNMYDLILKNATYYQKVESALASLSSLAQPASEPEFGVKVARFPVVKSERKLLEAIQINLQNIDQTSRSLLKNTRLNLLKHSDQNILFLLSALEEIAHRYLAPARGAMAYDQEGLLDYIPRDNLPRLLSFEPDSWPEIKVSFPDTSDLEPRIFAIPAPDTTPAYASELDYLVGLAEYALRAVDAIEQRLDGELQDEKLQQKFEGLEATMLRKDEQLNDLIDSLSQDLPDSYLQALMRVQAAAESSLREYSEAEDLTLKPELARASIACLEELKELAVVISQLPGRWDDIQQLYTEQVWNPFTATTMQDQVKERITKAYRKHLIPYVLDGIEAESACMEAERSLTILNALYARMQQLRTQNTSKLERKLKNEEDPLVLLEWFEVSMQQ